MDDAIYHEKQEGELCGVHCLNTLLQGSYFNEIDLATIAQALDEDERRLMMQEGAETPDFLKFMAEDSGNVADSGNYSIQVLEKALSSWDIKCLPITGEDAKAAAAAPLAEQAFICHLRAHWFTIRKIGDTWYNLNSLLKDPQILSDFYLQAFLDTLRAQGWSLFVIRGSLPVPNRYNGLEGPGGRWIPAHTLNAKSRPQQGGGASDEDRDLKAAIQASLRDQSTDQPVRDPSKASSPLARSTHIVADDNEDDDEELQRALEESELNAAIQASLQR
eukprot:TRINITY_DN3086_c0_g1_i1.p1 TRINITY_DN3086_c0_g1~~TRINITY_DN3086_c0_g1_i1.p1  ORF type:complete len:284 (+),score=82.38 TRINITY_DN3086_c0_g1_i1:25-852(+)